MQYPGPFEQGQLTVSTGRCGKLNVESELVGFTRISYHQYSYKGQAWWTLFIGSTWSDTWKVKYIPRFKLTYFIISCLTGKRQDIKTEEVSGEPSVELEAPEDDSTMLPGVTPDETRRESWVSPDDYEASVSKDEKDMHDVAVWRAKRTQDVAEAWERQQREASEDARRRYNDDRARKAVDRVTSNLTQGSTTVWERVTDDPLGDSSDGNYTQALNPVQRHHNVTETGDYYIDLLVSDLSRSPEMTMRALGYEDPSTSETDIIGIASVVSNGLVDAMNYKWISPSGSMSVGQFKKIFTGVNLDPSWHDEDTLDFLGVTADADLQPLQVSYEGNYVDVSGVSNLLLRRIKVRHITHYSYETTHSSFTN